MKKENIIKKSYEINKIIENNNVKKNRYFYIYKERNNKNIDRYVVCVSKKIGNAVTRNKIKRQIKDIIDKNKNLFSYQNDYVIIVRKEINNLNYEKISNNLVELFKD